MTDYRAPADLRIGHIHLHVSDLGRAVAFYRDVLGFDLNLEVGGTAAFLSAGGYHHHVGLNTWGTGGMAPDGRRRPGLYHFALNYPTRADLARAVKQVAEAGPYISGSADHHTHLAVYLSDPDGNGIELAWDREPEFWKPMLDPELSLDALRALIKPLDVPTLVAEAA